MNDTERRVYRILYDYSDVPTLRKFALDDSRVRYIQGPFGCLSEDTEYLSLEGWRRISEYNGERIAQFSLDTKRISFVKPERYIKEKCSSFLHLKNKYGVDQLLSDEHTVLYNTRFKPFEWRTIPAVDLAKKHNNLKDGWSGRIPTVFKAPLFRGVSFTDNELRLMVAISADGCLPKRSRKCAVGLRKERKKDRLRFLLKACNISWFETPAKDRPTEVTFTFVPPERNKDLWLYIRANEHQLSVMVDEFVHWDGHIDCYGGKIYSSTIVKNADFIQYALATTGVRATISEVTYPDNPKWSKGYRVYGNTGATELSLRSAPKIKRVRSNDGFKYCFTTKTGFFIARRNGRIFVTGNSGKSSACVMEIIRRAHEQTPSPDGIRRSRWAVVRNSYVQLRDTTIRTFHDWFPPTLFGEYRVTDHNYIITKFPGVHLEVLFRALDRPDQVANLLSLELTGAWFNEVREIPKPIVDAMDGRIARYPSTRDVGEYWHGMIMDTNPPDEDSWIYKVFEVQKPEGWRIFKQPSGLSVHAENTSHLAKNYYRNLSRGKDEMFIRVYVHGQYGFIIEGKPVFISFKDNVHVSHTVLQPERGLDVLVGFDFGLQPSCAIGQLTQYGQLRILDELVSDGMGIKQFCINQLLPLLRRKYFGMNIMGFGDPSGVSRSPTDEQSCFDVLHSGDVGLVNVLPASTNALVPRVGAVEDFLNKMVFGEPAFVLSPNCHHTRKAMNGAYHYERKRNASGSEEYKIEPTKNFASHIADALEMLCLYIGEKHQYDKLRQAMLAKFNAREKWRPATALTGY